MNKLRAAFCVAVVLMGGTAALADAAIKNVLFIVSDDLKASVLGCYGDKVCKTPNIDRLARQGMVFDRAYCQGTVCAPSRRSFMYSRYVGTKGINLGEHLKANGLYSARVGKIYHMRVPGDIIAGTNGQDVAESWTERFNSQGNEAHTPGDYACLNLNIFTSKLEGRQSTRMPHRMFVSVKYKGDGADQPDHKTATKTIELLRKHGDKPFFIAAGFVRPHYPMVAPQRFFDQYPFADMTLPPQVKGDLDDIPKQGLARNRSATNGIDEHPDNQKRMWAAYFASITFMDEQVGRILNELERLGLRESTAIVFLSDHGYHLGEHTFWQKANLHEEVTRVPLILSVPGFVAGKTDAIAELVDKLHVPTIVKETGCGLSPGTLARLAAAGVKWVDTAGAGGTTWTGIEGMRGGTRQQSLGETLREWGIPTAASVAYAQRAGFRIIASGGIRSGLDAARAIALGADAAGLALPFLRAFAAGGLTEVLNATAALVESLRSSAMLVGAPSVEALREAPRVLGPELRAWLD